MAERSGRFSRLEQAREEHAAEAVEPLLSQPPFDGSPRDEEGSRAAATAEQLHAQRQAQLESGLALDERSDDDQPFLRCAACETDAPRGAARCRTCQSALDTPEQRAFNQALWRRLRTEQAEERAREHARRAQVDEDQHDLEARQRALGEAIAEDIREQRGDRPRWMNGLGEHRSSLSSLGTRLLAGVGDPLLRGSLVLGLLGLAATLFHRALAGESLGEHPLPVLGLIALAILFFPGGRDRGSEL